MEECTFKPKLYKNNIYAKSKKIVINEDKNNIYNRQNEWMN